MVPFTNFTVHNIKTERKLTNKRKLTNIMYFLRDILFPPGYKNLKEQEYFSPFLQIKKIKKAYFTIPAIEASINSRWYQAMAYWMRPLSYYTMFLILFTTIPQFYNIHSDMILVGMFYYIGLYLLMIEFMQIRKYKTKYITTFNIFDLSSIILGIIFFSLYLTTKYDEIYIYLSSITLFLLWIEMVCFITFCEFYSLIIYINSSFTF
jgi:hypothetical protein